VRAALGFLTPLGGASVPTSRALPWFPVVGVAVGGAAGAVWHGAAELWPPLLAAVLVVVADLALTGLLHVDGVADAADGLLPHLAPERRLAVMAEPTVGAFGVVVVAATLLARTTAIASMPPDWLLLVLVWATSRASMAWTIARRPYARPGGLGEAFRGGSPVPAAVALLLALAIATTDLHRALAVAACWVTAAAVVALARRRVGGWTGDVLGAAGVVGETVALVAAAARW
jgi:adenosylcobinamide-GDP ribazoletransferase